MSRTFHSFCAVVERLPAKAVVKTVRLEAATLKADLLNQRRMLHQTELNSILTFSEFLKNAETCIAAAYIAPPVIHLAFYRKTLERLIASGDLPWQARDLFDQAFSKAVFAALDSL